MSPPVLIITMGMDYIAPARMPCELRRAGFRVALLAPRNALATHTGYVDQIGYFPEDVKFQEWIGIVAGVMRTVQPVLVLPGDDITLRTLMQLVLDPPAGLREEIRNELGTLIRQSLGNPAGWLDSVDKSRLFELARRNGVAVADGDIAQDTDGAIAIAANLGYPVIVRQMFGSAGRGAARCASAEEIRSAIRNFPAQDAWNPLGPPRLVVQRWVDGAVVNRASVAWNGTEIAGFTRGRLATYPGPLGPASVVEFAGLPVVAAATRALFALVGMHGLVGTQFIVDAQSGVPYLIEVNRRMLPATHSGARVGVDLAAALHAAVTGVAWTGPTDLPPGPGLAARVVPAGVVSRREQRVAAHVAFRCAMAGRGVTGGDATRNLGSLAQTHAIALDDLRFGFEGSLVLGAFAFPRIFERWRIVMPPQDDRDRQADQRRREVRLPRHAEL